MRKVLLFLCLVFFTGFVFACDGCLDSNICYSFGDVIQNQITGQSLYCDYNSHTFLSVKGEGVSCQNDFECASGFKCLSGSCTNSFDNLLADYNLLMQTLNNQVFCMGANYFCYNKSLSAPANASNLSSYICDQDTTCYQCNANLTWNDSLNLCIKGICSSTPGCLNQSSLLNASINGFYCSIGNCFECGADFDWNATNQSCQMKACSSTPGCLNQSNLTNGRLISNRFCSSGSCFACNTASNYRWDNSSRSCVYSATISVSPTDWTTIQFSPYDLQQGTEKTLGEYDRLQFSFEGRSYYLGVSSIDTSASKITYRIDPVLTNLNAFVGVDNKFDLNSDGKLDISVNLVAVQQSGARIILKLIQENSNNELPSDENSNQNNGGTTNGEVEESTNSEDMTIWLIVALLVFVFILIVVILIVYLVKSKKTEVKQSQPVQPQSVQPQQYRPYSPVYSPQNSQFKDKQ
jgi:hypothetical protein